MLNPFDYQGPTQHLIDRRGELDALQRAAADAVAVRLAAPRRFGKTTLIEAHLTAMRATGHRAVRVDCSKLATVADVAARVASAYASLPDDSGRIVRRWAATLSVSAKLGPAGVKVAARPQQPGADQARAALLELLDVPLRLHEGDRGLTVIAFDEFQDVVTADAGLDGLLRSVIQHHGRAAAYLFAGSEPSLMAALFGEPERPFFGQARPLELRELPTAEAAADIAGEFHAVGLINGSDLAVDEVVTFTGGHPQRTILIAHHLFNVLDEGVEVADPALEAITRALSETADAHQILWDSLDRVARLVCLALADGEAPTGQRLVDEHRVARSTLVGALTRLLADGRHVQRGPEGAPYLLDPLLGEWLRRR